jgi:hypothetical protein
MRTRGLVALRRLALLAAGAALAAALFPTLARWLPACPLHEWTGWSCPSCGASRAFGHLLRGEWSAAWRANLLAVAGGLGAAVAWVTGPWLAPRWAAAPARARLAAWLVAAAAIAVFGVLRNLPSLAWLTP